MLEEERCVSKGPGMCRRAEDTGKQEGNVFKRVSRCHRQLGFTVKAQRKVPDVSPSFPISTEHRDNS